MTNLVFRLWLQGAGLPALLLHAERIQGLPYEQRDEYITRSPLYQVEKLQAPILVHVATNDEDVNYVEDQQIVWSAARAQARPGRDEDRTSIPPRGARRSATRSPVVSIRRRSSASTRPSRSTRGTAPGPSSTGTCGSGSRKARRESATLRRRPRAIARYGSWRDGPFPASGGADDGPAVARKRAIRARTSSASAAAGSSAR